MDEDVMKATEYTLKQMQLINVCRTFKFLVESDDNVPEYVKVCCDELNALCDRMDDLVEGFKKEINKEVTKNG